MAHIILRRDNGQEFNLPNRPLNINDGQTGIISISRPYLAGNRRHTVMHIRVPVDRSRTLDYSRDGFEVVPVIINTAPHILADLLARARSKNMPLNLTRYQVVRPKRKFGRAHSLTQTGASRLMPAPKQL